MTTIVSFENVSKNYGDSRVIDNVSFIVEKATITTLIGPNGAGKTTIARLMLGIEKPTSGKISYISQNCAYIPQKINFNQNMPIDVRSLVKYLCKKEINFQDIEYFADISRIADMQLADLSGGQVQKVFLAAAMLSEPDLVILDEPTQCLDVNSQGEFYKLLDQLRNKYGVTIFMISHDMHTVMHSSDKVLCLNHHLCCSGAPEKGGFSTISQIATYNHSHDHTHT